MKSIKLRKIGLILAGAVFAVAMALNFQAALVSTDQVSGVSLENLMNVAVSQAEGEIPGGDCFCDSSGWCTCMDEICIPFFCNCEMCTDPSHQCKEA